MNDASHTTIFEVTPQGGSRLLAETSFTEKEELRAQPLITDIEMDSGGAGGVFETSSVANQPQNRA